MNARPPRKIPTVGARRPNAKQRILAAWRGVDLTGEEIARAKSSLRAGELMPRLFKDLRIESRQAEAEIVKVWNNLLDPTICAHAQPTGINKGTLFVTVDSNAWLDEIVRWRRKEILDHLQNSFGKTLIARISFRCG
jgi:hypothetical protein